MRPRADHLRYPAADGAARSGETRAASTALCVVARAEPVDHDHGLVAAVAVTVPLVMTIAVLVTASPLDPPGMAAEDPAVASISLTYW